MVEDFDNCLGRLADKISYAGATYLRGLQDHPRIAELLAHIETLDGLLLEIDVQQAVRRFLVQHPDKS